ncbi:unnamed protein product [Symbiodinium sp. CCMP2592]|nr:unnamed protein product [Symbiodinium sp. CCMP2592]
MAGFPVDGLNQELSAVHGQPIFQLSSCLVLDVTEAVQNYTAAERELLDSCRGFFYCCGLLYNEMNVWKLSDSSESVLLWWSRRFHCWWLASKVVSDPNSQEEWSQCKVWARITAKDQFYANSGYYVPDKIYVPWSSEVHSQVFVLKSLDGFFYATVSAHQQKNEKLMHNVREAVKTLESRDEEIKNLKRQLSQLAGKQHQEEELKKPKAEPQQPPAYRQVDWQGQQATTLAMGPRAYEDGMQEPFAEPATSTEPQQKVKAEEPKAEEPKAEEPKPDEKKEEEEAQQKEAGAAAAQEASATSGRAMCWSESHGDVSGYLKSGMWMNKAVALAGQAEVRDEKEMARLVGVFRETPIFAKALDQHVETLRRHGWDWHYYFQSSAGASSSNQSKTDDQGHLKPRMQHQ